MPHLIRFVTMFVALVLACASAFTADGWTSPVSANDPDGAWADALLAADGSDATYARNYPGNTGWGGYIEYGFGTSIWCSQVRVTSDFGYGVVDQVDLDVKSGGTWTNVFEGAIDDASPTIISFTGRTITDIRYRYHYTVGGWEFWLYEISAYASSPVVAPQVSTGSATSVWGVSADLHAQITDAGGAPCEVRFQYGTTASYGTDTAWAGSLATGDRIGAMLSGLSDHTTYHFRAQARNSSGTIVSGPDRTFTTNSTIGHRWIAPNGVSGSDWSSAANAIDDEPDSSARCQHAPGADQWSPFLTLTNPAVTAESIRVIAAKPAQVDAIDVQVYRDGSWVDVYNGTFTDGALQTYAFTPGTVSQLQVRLHVSGTGFGLYWNVAQVQILANDGAGTTVVWDGCGADTNWSTPENWSTDLVPGATDAVVFDGTSSKNAMVDAAVSVASVSVNAGYTGTITQNASVSTSGNLALAAGSWNAGAQTLTVGGDLTIASGAAFTAGTSTVSLTGTGTLTAPAASFYDLRVAAAGKTTLLGSDVTVTHRCTVVAGTLDFHNGTGAVLHLRGSGQLLDMQGALNAGFPNGGGVSYEATSATPVQVEGIAYGYASVRLLSLGGAAAVFDQTGAISATDDLYTAIDTAGGSVTWNTHDYDLSSASWMSIGNWGTSAGGTTLNAGASHVTVPSICWFTTDGDVVNMQSSSWRVANWATWTAGATVNVGTSTVAITGGDIGPFWAWWGVPHQFYNLVIDAGSSTVTTHGAVSVQHDLTVTTGILDTNDWALSVGHDATVATGGGIAAHGSAISVGHDLTIASGAGHFAAGSSTVTMSGTGALADADSANAFYDLRVALAGQTTTLATDVTVTHRCTVVAGTLDFHNGTGAVLHLRGSGQLLDMQGTLNAEFPNGGAVSYEATSASPVQVEGIDYGYASLRLVSVGGAQAVFNQAGAIKTPDDIFTYVDTNSGSATWNMNGYDVCSASWMSIGNWGSSLGATIINAGASHIYVPSITWITTDHDVINLQSSSWRVANWATWTAGATVNVGTSTVTVIGGDIGPSWAWWGVPHQFYNLVIDSPSVVPVHGAVSVAHNLSLLAGGLDANGWGLSVAGDIAATAGVPLNAAGVTLALSGSSDQVIDVGTNASLGTIAVAGGSRTVSFARGFSCDSFACDPGVHLVEAAGQTLTTSHLTLVGTAGSPISLASSAAGTAANLVLASGGTQSVAFVRVQDSHATGGPIDDQTGGVDLGGNSGWLFPGNPTPNQAPSFTKGSDQSVTEDAGAQSISAWATSISAGPSSESTQTVDFQVSNDNAALFSAAPAISPTGTLTFTPAVNANGVATVTVRIHDNGGTVNGGIDTSAPQTFTITVVAVNDAPSFVKGADDTVAADAGAQSIAGWATAISAGPADESGQAIDFLVSIDHPEYFSVQPSISSTGTLSFTPAAAGIATVTVRAHDNGGTLNSGVDTSAPQSFTITITETVAAVVTVAATTPTTFERDTAPTYAMSSSDQTGGPAFQWVDLSSTGTAVPISGDDVTSAAIPLGFSFPFFGGSFSTLRVCTNGWISFTSPSTSYSHTTLPSTSAPENLIAVYWQDLLVDAQSTILTKQVDATTFAVEFKQVARLGDGGRFTAEAILHADGTIVLQYQSVAAGGFYTVGIQNATQSRGSQWAYNQDIVHANEAVLFAPQTGPVNPGVFTLTRSGNTAQDLTVAYTLSGTATNGADYTTLPGTVAIPAHATSAQVLVDALSDQITEGDETVILTLAAGSGYTVGSPASATVTILGPTVHFTSATASGIEGGAQVTATVVVDGLGASSASVAYGTAPGTALAGTDYFSASGTLTFDQSTTQRQIQVFLANDTVAESDETFTIVLSSPTGCVLGSPSTLTVTIHDDDIPPTFINQAQATPNPVTGTTTTVTTLADSPIGEANLTYFWTVVGSSPFVGFSPNFSNAAKTATATFSGPGTYLIQVDAITPSNVRASSQVTVVVLRTPTLTGVSPATVTVDAGATQQFVASAHDQWNQAYNPAVAWQVSGGGSIDSNGLFTAGATTGTYTVTASVTGSQPATASVTVNAAPTVATAAHASAAPVTTTSTTLSVLGDDDGGEANLRYLWSVVGTPPGDVTLGSNGTHAARDIGVAFAAPGDYTFRATIIDQRGLTATSDVTVTVAATPSLITVTGPATVAASGTATFTATASDQFGTALGGQPTVQWSVIGQGGIDQSGVYTAGSTNGFATIVASASGHNGSAVVQITGGSTPGGGNDGGINSDPGTNATVTLTIAEGSLTGDKRGAIDGGTVFYSKNSSITVIISAATGGAQVQSVQVDLGNGTTVTAAIGSTSITVPEGDLSLTAALTLLESDGSATLVTSDPVRLIDVQNPPTVTFSYVYQSTGQGDSRRSLRSSMTSDADLVLLNGAQEADNEDLRQKRGMNVFAKSAFRVRVDSDDLAGLSDKSGLQVATITGGASVTLTATPRPTDSGRPYVEVSSFSNISADSIAYNATTLAPMNYKGRYTLHLHLVDRCGNIHDADEFKLWVKTAAPVVVLGRLPYQLASPESFEVAPQHQSQIFPCRWVVASPDVMEAWQDSKAEDKRLIKMAPTPTGFPASGSGPTIVSAWQLQKPIIPSGFPASVTITPTSTQVQDQAQVILRDVCGNTTAALPVPAAIAFLNASPHDIQDKDDANPKQGAIDGLLTEQPFVADSWIYQSGTKYAIGNALQDGPLLINKVTIADDGSIAPFRTAEMHDDQVRFVNTLPAEGEFLPRVVTVPPSWQEDPATMTVAVAKTNVAKPLTDYVPQQTPAYVATPPQYSIEQLPNPSFTWKQGIDPQPPLLGCDIYLLSGGGDPIDSNDPLYASQGTFNIHSDPHVTDDGSGITARVGLRADTWDGTPLRLDVRSDSADVEPFATTHTCAGAVYTSECGSTQQTLDHTFAEKNEDDPSIRSFDLTLNRADVDAGYMRLTYSRAGADTTVMNPRGLKFEVENGPYIEQCLNLVPIPGLYAGVQDWDADPCHPILAPAFNSFGTSPVNTVLIIPEDFATTSSYERQTGFRAVDYIKLDNDVIATGSTTLTFHAGFVSSSFRIDQFDDQTEAIVIRDPALKAEAETDLGMDGIPDQLTTLVNEREAECAAAMPSDKQTHATNAITAMQQIVPIADNIDDKLDETQDDLSTAQSDLSAAQAALAAAQDDAARAAAQKDILDAQCRIDDANALIAQCQAAQDARDDAQILVNQTVSLKSSADSDLSQYPGQAGAEYDHVAQRAEEAARAMIAALDIVVAEETRISRMAPTGANAHAPDPKKIIITGQRLVYDGVNGSLSQKLNIDVVVGSETPAHVVDVDVKCGAVHAYSDTLSQANAGANGAHRMVGGLAIAVVEFRIPVDGNIQNDDSTPTRSVQSSSPAASIEITDGYASISSQVVSVSLSGTVYDPVADIDSTWQTPTSVRFIGSDGTDYGTVALNRDGVQSQGFWRPCAYRAQWSKTLTITPNSDTEGQYQIKVITQGGATPAGSATARVTIRNEQILNTPVAAGATTATLAVVFTSELDPDAVDNVYILDSVREPTSADIPLVETDPSSQVFTGLYNGLQTELDVQETEVDTAASLHVVVIQPASNTALVLPRASAQGIYAFSQDFSVATHTYFDEETNSTETDEGITVWTVDSDIRIAPSKTKQIDWVPYVVRIDIPDEILAKYQDDLKLNGEAAEIVPGSDGHKYLGRDGKISYQYVKSPTANSSQNIDPEDDDDPDVKVGDVLELSADETWDWETVMVILKFSHPDDLGLIVTAIRAHFEFSRSDVYVPVVGSPVLYDLPTRHIYIRNDLRIWSPTGDVDVNLSRVEQCDLVAEHLHRVLNNEFAPSDVGQFLINMYSQVGASVKFIAENDLDEDIKQKWDENLAELQLMGRYLTNQAHEQATLFVGGFALKILGGLLIESIPEVNAASKFANTTRSRALQFSEAVDAENYARKLHGGAKQTIQFVHNGEIITRNVDCYVVSKGQKIAMEIKKGYIKENKRILGTMQNASYDIGELEKDLAMLEENEVDKVIWEFYYNAEGKIGANTKITKALQQASALWGDRFEVIFRTGELTSP